MKDLMGLMKQAKDMQAKMQAAQAEVGDLEATGRSGGGLVTITLAGGGNMKTLTLDPSLLGSAADEDREMLEDLIVAAFQDAKVKLDQAAAETMKSAMGDIPLPPGMKMPF
ncbi:YbaB/EbfC family nucleoid-associated protein [uncultured Algimonas sp.]|uniref:YbaB/EbfC family nucleoid-associated protein n=1 Tax=uncultured Algimonas sp. TaxID=1547920 RepID=UPI00261A0DCA|nr:YbaB/EbfC family nucleoid-associated protein [uncultured Algimonas sp.]